MSMSYHEFSNLNEIFQGDLNNKSMENMTSRDFMDLNCNCNRGSKIDGECIHGKECRKSIVVCKATCNDCGCYCIGNTQQKLKARMNTHFSETEDLINNGKLSDSFAKHFATHFKNNNDDNNNNNDNDNNNNENVSRGDIRNITTVEILWQGKPMSSIKTFKKLNCSLCARERLEIYKAMKKEKQNDTNCLMNSLNESH